MNPLLSFIAGLLVIPACVAIVLAYEQYRYIRAERKTNKKWKEVAMRIRDNKFLYLCLAAVLVAIWCKG